MALSGDHSHRHFHLKKHSTSFLFIFLLCSVSIFLAFSLFKPLSPRPEALETIDIRQHAAVNNPDANHGFEQCDYSDGKWIYDPTIVTKRYDKTCKEIFKGWNCMLSNKSNAFTLVNWRWKPTNCDLPLFDPLQFLKRFRNTNIVSSEVKKWRPVGADRGFTFLEYNLTIAYHRTNLLARYGRWSVEANGGMLESIGYKEGYRVDVDIPEGTWAEAPKFHDIVILNTGHWWWAPAKFYPVKSPMLFFKKGLPIIPPISSNAGLDLVLKNMLPFVERKMRANALKFFRTQSPRHFEGGDWDQGGSCQREKPLLPDEVEEFFATKKNGTNVETRLVNQHLQKAFQKKSGFHILDITHMSEFRADAHGAYQELPIHGMTCSFLIYTT